MGKGFVLSRPAQEDLTDIADYYLREAGPQVVLRILAEFKATLKQLAKNPGIGHRREDLAGPDVLFFPVRPYMMVYRRGRSYIEIIGILHAARDLPRVLGQR